MFISIAAESSSVDFESDDSKLLALGAASGYIRQVALPLWGRVYSEAQIEVTVYYETQFPLERHRSGRGIQRFRKGWG